MGGNVRETNLTKMKFFEEVAFKLSNEKDAEEITLQE